MAGSWEDDVRPPAAAGGFEGGAVYVPPPVPEPLATGLRAPGFALPAPDIRFDGGDPLEGTSSPGNADDLGRGSHGRGRLFIVGAVVASMVVAVAVVAGVKVAARASGVQAAFSSILSSPTLRVEVTAHAANAGEEASLAPWAVAVSVTSGNGQPLSGATDDSYDVSVLKNGADVADVVYADKALYARVNLQAIDEHAYESALRSMEQSGTTGPAYGLEHAFLSDEWVGITDSTVESLAKQLASGLGSQTSPSPNAGELRSAFTMSLAQSWHTWASIHQISSANGTTEYALDLPVQHFVATFLSDVQAGLLKAVPPSERAAVRTELRLASAAVRRIPAALEIPMKLWVTNGSLSRVEISYKGNSLDLAISHPTLDVSAPQGAHMITLAMIESLIGNAGPAGAFSSSGISGISGISGVSNISGTSGLSGVTTG